MAPKQQTFYSCLSFGIYDNRVPYSHILSHFCSFWSLTCDPPSSLSCPRTRMTHTLRSALIPRRSDSPPVCSAPITSAPSGYCGMRGSLMMMMMSEAKCQPPKQILANTFQIIVLGRSKAIFENVDRVSNIFSMFQISRTTGLFTTAFCLYMGTL